MNKTSKWMSTPITWGDSLKLTGITTAIATVIGGIYLVIEMEPAWFRATVKFVRRLFKR